MTREIEYLIKTVYDVPKAQLTMEKAQPGL